MEKITQTGEVEIKISDIIVGDRIREDLGDLTSLQLSIEIHGLLQPIIVQQDEGGKFSLIDGERRMQVHKRMHEKKIKARMFEGLDDLRRKEIELELCVKRKGLHYAEEAKAVMSIVDARKKAGMTGGLSRFGGNVKHKDIADSLGMSASTLAQNLMVARAIEDHPELETLCSSRNECLRRIKRKEFTSVSGTVARKAFEEAFLVDSAMGLLSALPDKRADLIILHPDLYDEEQGKLAYEKLRLGGSMIVFIDIRDMGKWVDLLSSLDMHVMDVPNIWSIKNESTYCSYLWAGKNRKAPIRMIPPHLTHPRSADSMSIKSKAPLLISRLVKCCTDQGGFVVVPTCEDMDTVRTCYDLKRSVRAACSDKILRDRLIMNSSR